jgi:hypothetical protein
VTDIEPDDEAPTPARSSRTVPAGAFILAVMVAAALAVLAVVALADGGGGGGDGSDRDVRLAAGRFAERFLTFEHDALDGWRSDVLALSTRGFAQEVEEVESGLRQLIADSELDATTQVTEIFVGEQERGAVEVVVVYDRRLRGDSGERAETDRYLQLAMIRVDGTWLVDNVIDIASAGALDGAVAPSDPADPATTTTVTEATEGG